MSEEKPKPPERALHESVDLYRLLMENVKDYAIFLLDPSGYVVSWNIGAERILGYPEAEILGQPFARIFTAEDRSHEQPESELRVARETGRSEDERWHLRKDGTRFWAAGVLTALRDENNTLRGFAKMLRDNTERKRIEEERRELLAREQAARTEAETANRLKDEFLATLSHEIRTPLTAILGWARVLRTKTLDEANTARAIESIERNAQVQSKLIEDLLDVSRIIAGKLHLTRRPVDLGPIINAAIETVHLAAETKGVQIQTALDPSVGQVLGDPERLQQVVWNLLTNAIIFTPRGGVIDIHLAVVGVDAQITVRDTGAGIAPDFLPHVFDRFRQADSSRQRKSSGLGLGLAIVRSLVELHGGTVRAESPGQGKGATFYIMIPLRTTRQPADYTEPTSLHRVAKPDECDRPEG